MESASMSDLPAKPARVILFLADSAMKPFVVSPQAGSGDGLVERSLAALRHTQREGTKILSARNRKTLPILPVQLTVRTAVC